VGGCVSGGGWISEYVDGSMGGCVDQWVGVWINGWACGSMDEWVEVYMYMFICFTLTEYCLNNMHTCTYIYEGKLLALLISILL